MAFSEEMKLEKRNEILQVALKHFTEQSFHNVSLRKIATELNLSVGNLYNYFHNKDALFLCVLSPLLTKIAKVKNIVTMHTKLNFTKVEEDLEFHIKIGESIADFVSANKALVYILFFHSKGSSLENFIDEFIEFNTERVHREICEKWGSEIFDTFFVHSMMSYTFNTINESLMHDLSSEERKKAFREMMAFVHYGIIGLATRSFGKGKIDLQKIFQQRIFSSFISNKITKLRKN